MYVGIDFGSSFLKFAQLSEDGQIRNVHRLPTLRSGNEAQRAEYLLSPMIDAVHRYIDDTIAAADEPVRGILISTQMHGYVLRTVDGDSHYISWQDELSMLPIHGETPFERLGALGVDALLQDSGLRRKSELALCSLFTRVCRGEQQVEGSELFTLGSYLIADLCGCNLTHITNAAPTGLYDLHTRTWNQPLLHAVGFTGLRLPEVSENVTPCGTYSGVPVYPDVGDQQASLLGAGLAAGQISINLGTASQVSIIAEDSQKTYDTEIAETRPFFNGHYLRTVSKLSGGRSLQVVVDLLRHTAEFVTEKSLDDADIWRKITQLTSIDSEIDSDGLSVKTGFFPTQLFPGGSIAGINAHNLTPENLICAACADIASQFGRVITCLDPGRQASKILLSGGRLSQLILPYLYADAICGSYPIEIADTGEAIFTGLWKMLRC